MTPPVDTTRPGRRPAFLAMAAILGAATVLAPIRIIYKANQDASVGTGEVVIKNYAFVPSVITVTAGTKITFRNADGAAHTVTSDDGSFDLGRIPGGGSLDLVATKSVTYHCDFHGSMTAQIVVEG